MGRIRFSHPDATASALATRAVDSAPPLPALDGEIRPAGLLPRLSGLAGRGLSRLADLGRATALDERAEEAYELHAPTYDVTSAMGALLRSRAVEALAPRSHEVIFDVGCGTGLNFGPIEQGIGPRGRLVGIDQSPAMLRRAEQRVPLKGWRNVTLLSSAAQLGTLDVEADGVLLCLAHDILRSPDQLAHVFAKVRPGGRVVAAGPKWAPWWALPVNVATWFVNLTFVTSFEGFEQPWDHLVRFARPLHVESLTEYFGGAYIVRGTVPDAAGGGA